MGAAELHEVFGVALVEDREVGGEAGGGAEAAEEAVGGAVEGSAMHLASGGAGQALGAHEHLLRGAAGEGEEEDAFGRDALSNEVGEAVDERAGLAGAGAGDDEQGAVAVGGGGALLGVELRVQIDRRGGCGVARARTIEARGVGRFGHGSGNIPACGRDGDAAALGEVPDRASGRAGGEAQWSGLPGGGGAADGVRQVAKR